MRRVIEVRHGRKVSIDVINEERRNHGVIFMFHGSGGRADQWRMQIPVLSRQYCLVIPDMLGHGHSEKPKSDESKNPYTVVQLCKDQQAIFDRFANDNNIVIGHSRGGALSTYLAYNNQEEIKKLILITPSNCYPATSVPAIWNQPVEELELKRDDLNREYRNILFAKGADEALIKIETEATAKNPMYVLKPMILGLKELPKVDVRHLFVPTLVIAADEDKITPVRAIKDFYSKLPQHKIVTVKHAGHLVMLEQSEVVNVAIMRFLTNAQGESDAK